MRGALERDALLAVGAEEVGGRPVYLRSAECDEGGAGGVDEVVGLEDGLGGRDGVRALSRDRRTEGERYGEERGGQSNARTLLRSNAAV
ncbi:MAG TPA: hypothetical protein VFK04_00685 [Gemmatimonadaceae bacterium]|nr:hypothetical protein [Gemmatimonadaceae bacterium]